MNCTNIIKQTPLAIAFIAITAFAVACKPSEDPSATETRKATAQQLDKVKKETKEASQAMKDYAYAQKAEFVTTVSNQLRNVRVSIPSPTLAGTIGGVVTRNQVPL